MALSIFVFITLLKLALSLPEPDPNVNVRVDVKVDDRGCGCCNNEKCCTFNGEKYRSGYNLVAGCAELCCNRDGEWEYKGIDKDCGNCTVGGEPWVYPFDHPWTPSYTTSADGEYVLTQLGLHTIPSSAYGVHGHFVGGSYVKGATYHENIGDWIYVFCNAGPISAPCSSLEVMGSVSGTITSFPNKQRNIWVFESMDCIIIVGVKLTVVMCPKVPGAPQPNDPYVYIYAPQSLRSWSSALYGLCKRYTFDPTGDYMARNGTIYLTPDGPFIESWIHQNKYIQN